MTHQEAVSGAQVVEPAKLGEIKLANAEAVHRRFEGHHPNKLFMHGFHNVMATIFHPELVYVDNTQEAVREHTMEYGQFLFSLGHANWFDPCNDAVAIKREAAFKPSIGQIVIPGNASYFNKPVFRRIVTTGGAIPIWRPKDLKKELGREATPEEHVVRKAANARQMQVMANSMNAGNDGAIFSEGTRNRGNRKQIQKFQDGIINTIDKLKYPEDFMVVTMSPYYGERKLKNILSPVVGIGHLAAERTATLTLEDIRDCQQEALDLAVETYEHSWRRHYG